MRPRTISEQEHQAMVDRVRSSVGVSVGRVQQVGSTPRKPESRTSVAGKPGSIPASSPFHYAFAITGQLPSGKNQVQMLWRRGKMQRVPNKTFTTWRAAAALELLEQERPIVPISTPVCLVVDYWPGDRIVRDVSGQLDALFSLLVHVHILKNDGLVHDVNWHRQALNRKFPKVLLALLSW